MQTMVRVKVILGDDNDGNFEKEVEIVMSAIDFLVIQDCMCVCSGDDYDYSWDSFIQSIQIQARGYLPKDWYVKGKPKYIETLY